MLFYNDLQLGDAFKDEYNNVIKLINLREKNPKDNNNNRKVKYFTKGL